MTKVLRLRSRMWNMLVVRVTVSYALSFDYTCKSFFCADDADDDLASERLDSSQYRTEPLSGRTYRALRADGSDSETDDDGRNARRTQRSTSPRRAANSLAGRSLRDDSPDGQGTGGRAPANLFDDL